MKTNYICLIIIVLKFLNLIMEEKELLQLCDTIYKKTLGYSLDRIVLNENGTTSHIHSDEFLDEHPERRNNPEFTEEEELEAAKYLEKLVEADYKQFGPLPLKNRKQ